MNYTGIDEKITLSPRMEKVLASIRARVKGYYDLEDTHSSQIAAGSRNPIYDEFREHPDTCYVINLANGIVRSWMETPVMIYPDEAVSGITRPIYPVMEHFSWGLQINEELFPECRDDDERAERAALFKRMEPLDMSYMHDEGDRLLSKEKYAAMRDDGVFWAGGYQGHTVPGYPVLLTLGLDGVLRKIDFYEKENGFDPAKKDFYEACRIIIRGMSSYLELYSREALRLSSEEAGPVQQRRYQEIAENCAYTAHKKPVTLYQAVQLTWCLSLWDWVDCMGRMDQYLLPFYEYSKEHGDVIPPEDAIASMVFKIWENGSHNVTLGGLLPDFGEPQDATNELSFLLLQVLRIIHDTHPRMSIRIHENTPPELLLLAVKMWAEGMSDPTVVSDKTVINGLTAIRVPLDDARDYTMLGCQEIEIPGKSNFGCEDGSMCLARIFEYTMNNGHSIRHPEYAIGPETGYFTDFETFEDFFAAFEKQLRFFTELFVTLTNKGQEIRGANYAKLVKTPFTLNCIERGIPHDCGGTIYNYGVIETSGLAAVADSFTAVKRLVFDEKKISKETLVSALKADFKGYEDVQKLLKSVPKFGNDIPEADEMAVRVLDLFWTMIGEYKSVRGDVFTGACSLLEGGIYDGEKTGALPDGRNAGEPLGNTMGPRPGSDVNGLTAMLKSVSYLPLEKGVGGTTLNVTLLPSLIATPGNREKIAGVITSYLMNGGQMAQITAADVELLKEAQRCPDQHQDLIVRVGGYSCQFVQLEEVTQNEIISRYGGLQE
ncbi:MAG: hypothetical protein IJL78_07125 [Lachnospiraceae bacterium]|nr:hypothetical protein [Lachnospiraceae bacterium]